MQTHIHTHTLKLTDVWRNLNQASSVLLTISTSSQPKNPTENISRTSFMLFHALTQGRGIMMHNYTIRTDKAMLSQHSGIHHCAAANVRHANGLPCLSHTHERTQLN